MRWALGRSDPANWLSDSADKRNQISRLIEENDRQFKPNLDHYKYSAHYPEQTAVEYRVLGEQFLERLEQRLNLTTYLVGDSMTLADAAIFPFVRQFAGVEPVWFQEAPYPKLRLWLKQSLESELFRSVMLKYAQWREGDTPIGFPSPS
jgi:glutathione S-transferase